MYKRFTDALLTATALLLFIPAALILISWNSIPGSRLYPIKSSLEDVALALTAKTPIASFFSLEFTDRRFTEATKLLSLESSTIGYKLLVAEAKQTQNIVVVKSDAKSAAQLIEQIEKYEIQIEQQQAVARAQALSLPNQAPSVNRAFPIPTPFLAPTPFAIPTIAPTTGTGTRPSKTVIVTTPVEIVIEEETPEEIEESLDEIIEELDEIKEELERQLPETANFGQELKLQNTTNPNEGTNEEKKDDDKNNEYEEKDRRNEKESSLNPLELFKTNKGSDHESE